MFLDHQSRPQAGHFAGLLPLPLPSNPQTHDASYSRAIITIFLSWSYPWENERIGRRFARTLTRRCHFIDNLIDFRICQRRRLAQTARLR